jgi:hypothetical protein
MLFFLLLFLELTQLADETAALPLLEASLLHCILLSIFILLLVEVLHLLRRCIPISSREKGIIEAFQMRRRPSYLSVLLVLTPNRPLVLSPYIKIYIITIILNKDNQSFSN